MTPATDHRPRRNPAPARSAAAACCAAAAAAAASAIPASPAKAQATPPAAPARSGPAATPPDWFPANGVRVGEPKLFDARTLALMAATAEQNLAGLDFFSRDTLVGALGRFQGGESTRSSTAVQLKTVATPAVEETVDRAADGASGAMAPQKSQTVTKRGGASPDVPAPAAPAGAFASSVTFGVGAQDLLGEQVALTYQVMNLRLLLQRALTDRVGAVVDAATGSVTVAERPQAVLGLQVGIRPEARFRNALAEVVVSVDTVPAEPSPAKPAPAGRRDARPAPLRARPGLSLVALMPESKTYNVATTASKTTGFGLGAVLQPVNLGVSGSQTRETLYLVRDTDTVALEGVPADDPPGGAAAGERGVRFGWQFRPVLGRPLVDPGLRQVYAVVALSPTLLSSSPTQGVTLRVRSYTYWRRYDPKTGAVGDVIPGSFEGESERDVLAPLDGLRAEMLRPKLTQVSWREAGGGRALVEVVGEQFAPGTGILAGDSPVAEGGGLVNQGGRRLQFVVGLADLATKPLHLLGGEGAAQPLADPDVGALPAKDRGGIAVTAVSPKPGDAPPVDGDAVEVTVTVRRLPTSLGTFASWFGSKEDDDAGVPHRHALVVYGDRVFSYGDGLRFTPKEGGAEPAEATLKFRAPAALARAARRVRVVAPFKGDAFSAEYAATGSKDFSATRAAVMQQEASGTTFAIQGAGFQKDAVRVYTGTGSPFEASTDGPLQWIDGTLLRLRLKPAQLKGLRQVIVQQGNASAPVLLPAPEAASPDPKFGAAPEVAAGDERSISLSGSDFDAVDAVTYLQQDLEFTVGEGGKQLTLLATPLLKQMCAASGQKEIRFVLRDGRSVAYVLEVKEAKKK